MAGVVRVLDEKIRHDGEVTHIFQAILSFFFDESLQHDMDRGEV